MYCPKCGTKNSENARFCVSCGSAIATPVSPVNDNLQNLKLTETNQVKKPTPTALIVSVWILWLLQFVPMGQVSIMIDIVLLICAIFLIFSKNNVGITNGSIVLILWSIGFFIGFFNALPRRF